MLSGIINFACYEDAKEYLGMANVTMPNISNKVMTVNGAGIPGDIDMPIPGHRDAMRMTFNFTDSPISAEKLRTHRRHTVDLRVAREEYDPTSGEIVVKAYKYVVTFLPISKTGGTVAPASMQGASVEVSVISIKEYIDGVLTMDFDPINFKDVDASGVDNLAAVRSALGK